MKIVIYGGSGGIGSAIARKIAARGGLIHLAGRNAAALETLAQELGVSFTVGDVEDSDFFSRATSEAGSPISGLVYAVGTINLKPLPRMTSDDFLRDYRVNAAGAALAVQAALAPLKASETGASVVLFSSVAAHQGFSAHSSTGMVKAAVSGLTLSLAAELAPKVRVNAIAPSLTRTPLASGLLNNEQLASAIAKLHPLERLGTADDIADLAAFLLSENSTWITGQIFGVDGGRSTLRVKG